MHTKIKKHIYMGITLLLTLLFSIPLFCIDEDIDIMTDDKHPIITKQPLGDGAIRDIIAEDGTKFVISPISFGIYMNMFYDPISLDVYGLMCEDETAVLVSFIVNKRHDNRYFSSDDVIKINKSHSFENLDVYYIKHYSLYNELRWIFNPFNAEIDKEAIIRSRNIQPITTLFWIDKNNNIFNGGDNIRAYQINKAYNPDLYTKEQFFLLKDFYIDLINRNNKEMSLAIETFSRCHILSLNYVFNAMLEYDTENKQMWESYLEERKSLIKELSSIKDKVENQERLEIYTKPLSIICDYWPGAVELQKLDAIRNDMKLPRTDEEFVRYMHWLDGKENINDERFKSGVILDFYGIPIKYELLEGIGIKATSAGRDKVFDTEDDQVHISTYEENDM